MSNKGLISYYLHIWKNSGVSIIDGYFYYLGENNAEVHIYRAPVDNLINASKVYKLVADIYSGHAPLVGMFKMDDDTYISHHVGGGIMGHNVYCRINEDGIGEEVISGYMDFRMVGEDMVVVDYGVPPFPGNLYYLKLGQEGRISLGNRSFIYGWIREAIDEGLNCSTSKNMTVIDRWVYITGFELENVSNTNKIYKINIDTNEVTTVCDMPVRQFSIIGDEIYMVNSEDGKLYKKSMTDGQENEIIDTAVFNYIVDKDRIYYISSDTRELFSRDNSGAEQALLSGKRVINMELVDGNLICVLDENEAYGLVVFDKSGKQVFKTSDKVNCASAEGNLLVYTTSETHNSYIVQLP